MEAIELAAALITGLGGGGAIVFGLSSWIGKVWANRILEKEKAEHSKEIEHYKSELNKELQRVNAIQDKALYISKAQYDNEYRIYQEIWEKMFNCVMHTKMLYPQGLQTVPSDPDEFEKYQLEKYKKHAESFNSYLSIIDRYAPFYKKEFYDMFTEIRIKCREIGMLFHMYELEVKYSDSFQMARGTRMSREDRNKVYHTIPSEIDEIVERLKTEIRDYLLSLQLVK